jgi:hypothetical protein
MIVVRFADDMIVGFEHEHEAKAFLQDLQATIGRIWLASMSGTRPATTTRIGELDRDDETKTSGPIVIDVIDDNLIDIGLPGDRCAGPRGARDHPHRAEDADR